VLALELVALLVEIAFPGTRRRGPELVVHA
jgi:hypothetical protein